MPDSGVITEYYQYHVQVELASLEYRSSRLVRVLDTATGQRLGFGVDGATEVVSARYACCGNKHLLLSYNPERTQ